MFSFIRYFYHWGIISFIACTAIGLISMPVHAVDDLESYVKDHFEDLYKKYNTLDQQSLRFLGLRGQIEALAQENRYLRSQIEEIRKELKKQSVKKSASSYSSQTSKLPLKTATRQANRQLDQRYLDKAKLDIRSSQFAPAIKTLEPLIASNNSSVAIESLYWLGIAYVSNKDCPNAMVYLNSFSQTNYDHILAPEALFAYGLCQKSSGDIKGYQMTINSLKKRYPDSIAAKNVQ